MSKASLTYPGAAGTVAGSRPLLRLGGRSIPVVCTLFQGLKDLRLKNGDPSSVDPSTLDDDGLPLTPGYLDSPMAINASDMSQRHPLDHRLSPNECAAAIGPATYVRDVEDSPEPTHNTMLKFIMSASRVGQVRIHGDLIPVRAETGSLPALSAHPDADEIVRWLGGFERPLERIFIVHGEPAASTALAHRIRSELGWTCDLHAEDDRRGLA